MIPSLHQTNESDDLKPEVGDTISYGTPVYDKYGNCIADAPREKIRHVYKNGAIIIGEKAEKIKLHQGEYTILSKAG